MPHPYLLLSLSIDLAHPDAGTVVTTVDQRIRQWTHAWLNSNTVAVRIPDNATFDAVITDMTTINQAFDPCFTCAAVYVPYDQFCWVSDRLSAPQKQAAKTVLGSVPQGA